MRNLIAALGLVFVVSCSGCTTTPEAPEDSVEVLPDCGDTVEKHFVEMMSQGHTPIMNPAFPVYQIWQLNSHPPMIKEFILVEPGREQELHESTDAVWKLYQKCTDPEGRTAFSYTTKYKAPDQPGFDDEPL